MQLDELKKSDKVKFWITDTVAAMKDGSIAYTQYFRTGGGGLVLREALEPECDESPAGLARRADAIEAGELEPYIHSEEVA